MQVTPNGSPSHRSGMTSDSQAKNRSLPGQLLASTKSRTCAASHFKAFKLFRASSRTDSRKSLEHVEFQPSDFGPRLPGRVLEDTLSRTCAAAYHPQETHLSYWRQPAAAAPKGEIPRPDKEDFGRWQGKENPTLLAARRYSPRQPWKGVLNRVSSRERLPRPTLPPPSTRRKTIAEARPATAFAPRSSHPRDPRLDKAMEPRLTPRYTLAPGYPQPQSDPLGVESRIRTATPSVPVTLGTSLPSWARIDAGMSLSQKLIAHSSAEKLQRAFRKWWFRNFSSSGPMGFRALRDAVMYLQRWWRLIYARRRRRLHLRRLWKRSAIRMLLLEDAVVLVQRGWHMVKVRYAFWDARQATMLIQRAWRHRLFHINSERKRFAMAKLRSWHRRSSARDRLLRGIRGFYQVQHEAAVAIQSLWRGRQTRFAFAESRERLERARDRREIIRRKAQLLEMKQTISCSKATKAQASQVQSSRQETCQEPLAKTGPSLDDSQKSVGQMTTPRDGRGMQPRSKRPSYGQSRVDTATPRGTHQARLSGALSTATSAQNAGPQSRTVPSVPLLIQNLINRGCLSSMPCASPFSPELSGHSDLDAVRNWLAGALGHIRANSWLVLVVVK